MHPDIAEKQKKILISCSKWMEESSRSTKVSKQDMRLPMVTILEFGSKCF